MSIAYAIKVVKDGTSMKIDLRNLVFDKNQFSELMVALKENEVVRSVNVGGVNIGDVGVKQLTDVLKTNHTITEIDLHKNNIQKIGAKHLADALTRQQDAKNKSPSSLTTNVLASASSAVRVLNLSDNPNMGEIGAKHIAEIFRTNKSLTSVNLANNKINDAGIKYIAEALKTNSTITWLGIENNAIGAEGAKHIAKMLTVNTVIATIILSNNRIEAEGVQSLAESLVENKSMSSLYIAENKIGDDGAKYVADILSKSSISRLDISNNGFTDVGAKLIATTLKDSKTIRYLHLRDNPNIGGNDGIKHIADALKVNYSLTLIHLGKAGVSDQAAKELAEALKINRSLRSVFLANNGIKEGAMNDLIEALKVNKSITTLDLGGNLKVGKDSRSQHQQISQHLQRNISIAEKRRALTAVFSCMRSSSTTDSVSIPFNDAACFEGSYLFEINLLLVVAEFL